MSLPSWFHRLMRRNAPPASNLPPNQDGSVLQSVQGKAPDGRDNGMRVRSAEDILEGHQVLIQRIKLSYGSDRDTFNRELLPLITRYIQYVLDLPATPNNFFCEPGGLAKLGLRTGFFALQATDDQIFEGRSTITTRRHLEPRWRQATFIAGLCTELHRTLSHIEVRDDAGRQWQPFLAPLSQWATRRKAKQLMIRWQPDVQETRSLGLFALPFIVPAETMAYLADSNHVVVPHMLASITGSVLLQQHNLLDELVRRAAAFVIDHELQDSASEHGDSKPALHLSRHFLAVMRELISTNTGWAVNSDKSRAWHGQDGLFIIWPNAATDMLKLLDEQLLPGLPKSAAHVQDILLAHGVIQVQDNGNPIWLIRPPDTAYALEAVKISNPAALFADRVPAPLATALVITDRREDTCQAHQEKNDSAATTGQAAKPTSRPNQERLSTHSRQRRTCGLDGDAAAATLPPAPATQPSVNTARMPAPATERPAASVQPDLFALPPDPAPIAVPASSARAPAPPAWTVLSLQAPMRLNPALIQPLTEIVHTLNLSPALMACRTTATGIFIPLSELAQRQVDVHIAVRAMTQTAMLVQDADGAVACNALFHGQTVPGIMLKPALVRGLHSEDFMEPEE